MALIEMNGVDKKYRRSTTALRDINVKVNQGEFVYISLKVSKYTAN